MPQTLPNTMHFRLALQLREQVRELAPGSELPTQRELMQHFKVSQLTLEKALARLRREGLVHRPAGKQRLVRADLCDPALRRIIFVRPDYPSDIFEAIIRIGVEAGHAKGWGFDHIYFRDLAHLDLARAIGDNDAAVLQLGDVMPDSLRRVLRRSRKPVVLVQESGAQAGISSVASDDARMAEMAVEHFAALGHREVAMLLPSDQGWAMSQAIAGWRKGVTGILRADPERWLINCHNQAGQDAMALAYSTFRNWLAQHPPVTALYAATTPMALGALRALREAHFNVPRDMCLVVSCGLSGMGPYLAPPATGLEYDLKEYGHLMIDALEAAMTRPEELPKHYTLKPYLVQRESTVPLDQMAHRTPR